MTTARGTAFDTAPDTATDTAIGTAIDTAIDSEIDTEINTASAVYLGEVRHARYAPKRHRFRYGVFSMLLDLDCIEDEAKDLRFFSVNRFNWLSFHYRDHGFHNGSSPRVFVDQLLQKHGLPQADRVLLMCYPRMLGYVFNPLSVYYALQHDQLTSVIYEVRNTFGESHIYVSDLRTKGAPNHHTHHKQFHVSPFIGMEADYVFSTAKPDDDLRLVIRETVDHKPLLITSFVGQRRAFTSRTIIKVLFQYPLMTLKVIAGIHLEALRLWMKRVPIYKKPSTAEKVSL